ncbi:coiled-coil domain-containing protein 12 [Erpetoichthys calabaricus]|uniref:Coiled-coil domain containing 12 n=1 Tax=Erpetoichthys calabaricus TaxID=27687 RepID=A0A8C4XC45_ERPCA|nr:coiled-coil domain-containing protein 12 [Erpetoichthys calabaricus]
MEKPVGSLQEEALKRKERLRAIRSKQINNKSPDDEEPENKRPLDEAEEMKHRELRLRNYTPEDEVLKERQVPKAKPVSVEEKVKDQLEAAEPAPVIEEVDLVNLAPRKPDWDLKRDVAKKLERLEKRTQRAIAELIRERLKGNESDLASAVGAVKGNDGNGSDSE